MGQRRPRSVKEWKKETSLKNELGFLILNINVHQNSWRFPACAFQSNTCWNNSFEGNVTTVSKINSKRHYFSTSLTKTYCDSGMNSYWRRRRRGGSIVLVWYRQNLHNDQALKEANAKFPFSKVFLVVFESDRKNFILKLHHTENFCNDIVFFPDSGCPSLDVPFAAYNLGARHVFASVSVDHFDMEVQKVRNSCFRHGIYFHISVGTYSAKYLFSCTASFVFGTRAQMPALADSSPTTIWEKHLRRGSVVPYQISEDLIREGKCEDDRPVLEKFIDWLARIYLPDGYPNSVTKDYLSYSVWRAIQNLASSIMGVFATEALLFGLGLGRKSTPATSAAISWVLKDGLGYIGKVFYGSIAGNQFDVDPKSWRLVADAVEDAGGVLEIVTPLFPGHFLLLASVANAMKGVAAMTGTATRHAIYKSLALRENQGDIATKGESQGVTCKMVTSSFFCAVLEIKLQLVRAWFRNSRVFQDWPEILCFAQCLCFGMFCPSFCQLEIVKLYSICDAESTTLFVSFATISTNGGCTQSL